MIVREEDGQLLLVRQSDHAMLSGWLAAAWGAPPWEAAEPRAPVVIGARLHDLAWVPWDESPARRPDGRPYAFNEVGRAITTRLYRSGVESVAALDRYAGLLVSLHYSGFYVSHWGWRPLSPDVPAGEREHVRVFVEGELERQSKLSEGLGVDRARDRRLACAYLWLQLWDRVSLDICRHGFSGWQGRYPAVPLSAQPGAREVELEIWLEPGGVCRLRPYPLVAHPHRALVPALRVPLEACRSDAAFARALGVGGGDAIDVTFVPG